MLRSQASPVFQNGMVAVSAKPSKGSKGVVSMTATAAPAQTAAAKSKKAGDVYRIGVLGASGYTGAEVNASIVICNPSNAVFRSIAHG